MKVKILSFYHEPFFPFGKLYVKKNNFSRFKKTEYINYLNLPILKDKIIKKKILQEFIKYKNENITFITYNFSKIIFSIVKDIKDKKINWISICADYDTKNQKEIFQNIKKAKINIFLSKKSYDNYNYKNKLFFNGFQNKIVKSKRTKRIKNFLYSGSLEKWTGLDNFIKNFIKIKNNNIKLLITSNSNKLIIKKYFKDKRIKYLGFLSEQKYQKVLHSADCFINLRDINNQNNQNNFPSKLLQYLPHCKPIISSELNNIEKKLKKILLSNKNNNYKKLINKTINFKSKDLNKISKKILKYNQYKKKKELVFIKKIDQVIKNVK